MNSNTNSTATATFNSTSNVKPITLSYGTWSQKFEFPSPPTLSELSLLASKTFRLVPDSIQLSYIDDEEEKVGVRSDLELQELYAPQNSGISTNIYISVEGNVDDGATEGISFPSSANGLLDDEESQLMSSMKKQLDTFAVSLDRYTKLREQHITHLKKNEDQEKRVAFLVEQLEEKRRTIEELETKNKNWENSFEAKKDEFEKQTSQLASLNEVLRRLGTQLTLKTKEVAEVKRDKDSAAFQIQLLETKLANLEKQLNDKASENLQLSRVMTEVKSENEVLLRQAENLKTQLHQSFIQLEQSRRVDTVVTTPADHPGPEIVFPKQENPDPEDTTSNSLNIEDAQDILYKLGYTDRERNLTLLSQYGDISKVVAAYTSNAPLDTIPTPVPPVPSADLPADISDVEMQMLSAMGFYDKEKNIRLLRQYQDIDAVINHLLGTIDL